MADNPLSGPLSRVLGAIMTGAGIAGAISAWNKYPGYPEYSEQLAQIQQNQEQAGIRADSEMANAWAGYAAQQKANVAKGLAAQNITDPSVRARAMGQTETALSGAYANARAALERAKTNATSGLSSSLAGYYGNMAQKQQQAALQKYIAEMGIWGTLGGVGATLLNIPDRNKQESAPEIIGDNQEGFGIAPALLPTDDKGNSTLFKPDYNVPLDYRKKK